MKGNRLESFNILKFGLGTPFVLITKENVSDFEAKKSPFHPAVKYTLKNNKGLSGVHLSDYFRVYLSYHFGGAYHDIKYRFTSKTISHCWKVFEDKNVWLVGMPNINGDAGDEDVKQYILEHDANGSDLVASEEGKWNIKNSNDDNLISVGAWIARPKTEIFKKVINIVHKRLDSWFENIKRYPVLDFKRCCQEGEVVGYPVAWQGLLGGIFHPYQAVYRSHIDRSMPWYNSLIWYGDDSEKVSPTNGKTASVDIIKSDDYFR